MTSVVTPPGTLCFCDTLFTPKPRSPGKDPDYSCVLLFDQKAQGTEAYKLLKMAVMDAIKKEWGDKKAADPDFVKKLTLPFRDAAEKEGKYDGFESGKIFISPWSKGDKPKPEVIDINGDPILAPKDVFAGQIARASVRAYAWTNSGKMGVSLALDSVQILIADMPRIDGKVSAKDRFGKAPIEGLDLPTTKAPADFPF